VTRSLRPDVRNPLLKLPAAQAILDGAQPWRATLRRLLLELSIQATAERDRCLRTSKFALVPYWHGLRVYSWHLARLLK
jgi:hypothetical protein